MGVILDSNMLIAAERRGDALGQAIHRIREVHGEQQFALSGISIIELTHGIHRGRLPEYRERRRIFVHQVCRDLTVYPVTLEIAQLAGRIEGEQAAKGIAIPWKTWSSARPPCTSASTCSPTKSAIFSSFRA